MLAACVHLLRGPLCLPGRGPGHDQRRGRASGPGFHSARLQRLIRRWKEAPVISEGRIEFFVQDVPEVFAWRFLGERSCLWSIPDRTRRAPERRVLREL